MYVHIPLICGQDGYVVAQWGLNPFEVSCIQRQFQKKDVIAAQNKHLKHLIW